MKRIKECIKEGLRCIVLTTAIAGPIFVAGEYINQSKDTYKIIERKGLKSGSIKTVESFKEEYKQAEPWRAMLYWYDPQVVRHIKFTDGSEATLKYPLFRNCSFTKRKVLGPEAGEKCMIEDGILKRLE